MFCTLTELEKVFVDCLNFSCVDLMYGEKKSLRTYTVGADFIDTVATRYGDRM